MRLVAIAVIDSALGNPRELRQGLVEIVEAFDDVELGLFAMTFLLCATGERDRSPGSQVPDVLLVELALLAFGVVVFGDGQACAACGYAAP